MKTKKLDQHDPSKSFFEVASCRRHHPFSKTTPFADISKEVVAFVMTGGAVTPLELILD